MDLVGRTRIFKNENGLYSTSVSNKKDDNTYENMYIAVNFRKGIEVSNNTEIRIIHGFLSFYKTKEGLPKPKIVITDFEFINKQTNEFSNITDDMLPF